ncbi:MAG: hypothetical protein CBC48_13365 [bacterium TMED88]|nr:hypothetical protein [Deltaproteobacteria bacterium]OUV28360.1 MAG: hypothetical protein CBC48_13365 [bacterium TMED88]
MMATPGAMPSSTMILQASRRLRKFCSLQRLSPRLGIGPVIGIDGRKWSQAGLRAIVAALSLLSADELRLPQGLPFVRRH